MSNHLQSGITIFTPTYNRAPLLGRLYESLKQQACPQLQWLIVDDGSTDNTRQVVEAFTAEGILEIRYLHKENGGKHTALNMGIREAGREYFLCIDSDDILMPGAFSLLLEAIQSKPIGIIAYKQNMATKQRIGDPFPEGLQEATLFNLINKYHSGGDRTLVYPTQLLRKYPFPEPPGQRFFPETWLYDQLDLHGSSMLIRQQLCSCEYLPDGYSASFRKVLLRNSLSMKWFYADRLDMPIPFKLRFDAAYRYIGFSLLARSPLGCCRGKHWALLAVAFPMGLALALSYRIRK